MARLLVTLMLACFLQCDITSGQQTEPCIEKINSCACRTANGYINLEKLDQAKQNGQPKWSGLADITYPDTTYSYNPCTAFTSGTCTNVTACQTQYSVSYPLGTQDTATFQTDATLGTLLTYTTTDGRITKVQLVCDIRQEGTLSGAGEDLNNPGTYNMKLTTKYACPNVAPGYETTVSPGYETSTTGGHGAGIRVDVLVIIVLSVLLTVFTVAAISIACYKCCNIARAQQASANVNVFMVSPGEIKNAFQGSSDKQRDDTKCILDHM